MGMSRSKHTEAAIIAALKQLEAGRKGEDLAREQSVSKHTSKRGKAKYGGHMLTELVKPNVFIRPFRQSLPDPSHRRQSGSTYQTFQAAPQVCKNPIEPVAKNSPGKEGADKEGSG